MKVLYLMPQPKRPDRIGAYTFLDEEIQALAQRGVDAFVLSTAVQADTKIGAVHMRSTEARASFSSRVRAANHLVSRSDGLPMRSVRYPLRSYRSTWMEHVAATIIRQEKIDLIHSHFAWPQGLGGTFARALTGKPLVASLRGTDILEDPTIGYGRRRNEFFARALSRLLNTADRTVYFSEYMRRRGVSLGARPESTRVIRKGVDLRHFTPSPDRVGLRRALGLPGGWMVLTVGGLIRRKGIHHVIEALRRIGDLGATLVVCGEGPERSRLEALAAMSGVGERVIFTGRVDRQTMPEYFAACDVFVLASSVEAAGNVVFEAMSCGRPVVTTDSGGPGEYVTDGQTGFVVPVDAPDMLAERLRLLLTDEALREVLGAEARRRTIEDFDYDRMVDDVIDIYREVVEHMKRGQTGTGS